ncbi:unnamed protein product [Chironomus riparius]|uniref:Uncharacterized protein n=1 Tax=Chironomus riparius TaxID=315576 RepID=A0A9N9WNS6_9DIPT|nr:unnamed protein product [Chironomus riparius]
MELAIMKKWEREKKQMVVRHDSTLWLHESQFILNFIFDDNEEIRDEEIERKFKLFDALMANEEELFLVLEFIFDYIKNEARNENQIFHEKVQNLLFRRFEDIHKNIMESEYPIFDHFRNYAKTVSICDKTSRKLWKVDENKNVLQDLIPKFKSNTAVNFKEITVTAEFCFGADWHEKFNKSGKKFLSDEELKRFETKNVEFSQQQDAKRSLKLCDLVDKNFNADEKEAFYKKVDLREVSIIDVKLEIISRMRDAVVKKSFFIKMSKGIKL